jgi:glycosidase
MFTIPGLPVVYYGSEFGMTGADDPDNRRMMRFDEQLDPRERDMLEQTRAIAHLRNSHSALRYGDFLTLKADESVYSFLRADFRERLLIVLNKNESVQSVDLKIPRAVPCHSVTDLKSGEVFTVNDGSVRITVEGIGWRVLRVN